jgi:hypothetical protein
LNELAEWSINVERTVIKPYLVNFYLKNSRPQTEY